MLLFEIFGVLVFSLIFASGLGFLAIIIYVKVKRRLWLFYFISISIIFPGIIIFEKSLSVFNLTSLISFGIAIVVLITITTTIRWLIIQLYKLGYIPKPKSRFPLIQQRIDEWYNKIK